MTHEEILAKWESMTPRERDAWIAEKVMRIIKDDVDRRIFLNPPATHRYSTDIAAAMGVEERIFELSNDAPLLIGHYMTELILICGSNGFKMVHANAEQRCKAALLAVMGE